MVQPMKLGLMLVMVDHMVQSVKLGLMSAVVDHVVPPVKLDVMLVVVDHMVGGIGLNSIEFPTEWDTLEELVNLGDELLDMCTCRIKQQHAFDRKPLGLAVSYGCGHL